MPQPNNAPVTFDIAHLLADIRAGLDDAGLHGYRADIRMTTKSRDALLAANHAVAGARVVLDHVLSKRTARERAEFRDEVVALRILAEQIQEALRRVS